MPTYIGIDIAKSTFDADIKGSVRQFTNDDTGARALLKATRPSNIYIIEATGNYSTRLAEALCRANRRVKLVNPLAAKRFAQSQLSRSKTDKIDAQLLTAFGPSAKVADYEPKSDDESAAKQHQSVIEQLIKQRTALKNQLEAVRQLPRPAKEVLDALNATIKHIDTTIEQLRKSWRAACEAAHPGMLQRLESIKGIGEKTAPAIITATQGFAGFEKAEQVVCYIGACPTTRKSGTSVRGDGRISRLNNPTVRTKLYMGAMTAIRYDNEFRATYDRLRANGKPKKVALMGVINKMLRVAFAVAKHGTMYEPKFLSKQSALA